MGYRIKEVSDMSGISIRMLRHYDKTGLLKPDNISENGYRDYSGDDLEKLRRIMYLKELEFSIPDMIRILKGSENDVVKALKGQEKLLLKKKERLEGIIRLLQERMKNEKGYDIMSDFKTFDMKEIEEHKKKYAEEAEQKYGKTDAYRESKKRTDGYKAEDWKRITEEADAIYGKFAAAMVLGPDSAEAGEAVNEWQDHITRNYYECTDEILLGLADMYISDPRFTKNINKHSPNLAQFITSAIKHHRK